MTRIPQRPTTDPGRQLRGTDVEHAAGVATLAARFADWQESGDAERQARFRDFVSSVEPEVARFLFSD